MERLSKGLWYPFVDWEIHRDIGDEDCISHLLYKGMESLQTILMSGNEELVRVNIQRGIFQGDTLSPLFVIGLIPLSHTLRKVNAGYQLGKGQYKKINRLLFMDDLKLYGNSEREAGKIYKHRWNL